MGGINQQGYVTSSPSIFGSHRWRLPQDMGLSLSSAYSPPRYHLFSSVKLIAETRGILRDSEARAPDRGTFPNFTLGFLPRV